MMERSTEEYVFEADLWVWSNDGTPSWFFVTLPREHTEDLRLEAGPPRGFGSVRVEVTIGATTWRTSVFPQAESGCFVLPVKKVVRSAEGLDEGTRCSVLLRLAE